jgi:NAD-dependent dihydropyrimidine dehydrogenase PreA subunit
MFETHKSKKKFIIYKYMYKNLYTENKDSYLYIHKGGNTDIKNIFAHKNDKLNILKNTLKLYIATPWNSITNSLMTMAEYGKYAIDYVRLDVEHEQKMKLINEDTIPNKQKVKFIEDENKIYSEKKNILLKILKQGHAGDLLEHSQWCFLQLKQWFNENNDIIKDIHMNTAIVSALLHDIGKAGDCNYNMYDPSKYDKQGEAHHPEYCGDMILGKRNFIINCNEEKCLKCTSPNEECTEKCVLHIPTFIQEIDPNINIKHVAITAYMHWEFGVINRDIELNDDGTPNLSDVRERANVYIDEFKKVCNNVGITPTLQILKLCIAISCADITAGTNIRLRDDSNLHEDVMRQKYVSYDPWVSYDMYKRYKFYRQIVLEQYKVLNT